MGTYTLCCPAGLDAGSIRHFPSNQDILRVASMRIRSYSGRRLMDLDREPGTVAAGGRQGHGQGLGPGQGQGQGQGLGRQLPPRFKGQSLGGTGTAAASVRGMETTASAGGAAGGRGSAASLLQALLPASFLQRIGVSSAAGAGAAGSGMRASQSTARWDRPGEASTAAAAAEGEGAATPWRRSFTDPCECEPGGGGAGSDEGGRRRAALLVWMAILCCCINCWLD